MPLTQSWSLTLDEREELESIGEDAASHRRSNSIPLTLEFMTHVVQVEDKIVTLLRFESFCKGYNRIVYGNIFPIPLDK